MRLKNTLWMAALGGLVLTVGMMSHPTQLLAQVKATLVRSVDEPGREPYQEQRTFTLGVAPCPLNLYTPCQVGFAPVPAGKRLVMKTVSYDIPTASGTGAGTEILTASLTLISALPNDAQRSATFYVPNTLLGTVFAGAFFESFRQGNLNLQGYADAGTTPIFAAAVFSGGVPAAGNVTLTGYYVDIP